MQRGGMRLIMLSIAFVMAFAPAAAAAGSLPPPAPAPTDGGNSPMAPDPHPPLGGLGPDGEVVGGTNLRARTTLVPPHVAPLPASLTAQAWVLFDAHTGAILAARDPHGRYQPASILKTLTCVTLLPQLPGTQQVLVDATAANTEGSHAGLVAGGTYTVDQLFAGLLLVSGNDTAMALAEAAGGVSKTVELMNSKAIELGAYDTFVQTPSGLDGWQQLTSAYDMALFLRAALDMPRFVAYEREHSAELPVQQINGYGPVTLVNQNNQFLDTVPGALVAKTGYTDAAQHTFAGAVSRHGRTLGVIFLRAQRYPSDQWQQASDLVDWGFALPAGTPAIGQLSAPDLGAAATKGVAAEHSIGAAQRNAVGAAPASVHRGDHLSWLMVGLGILLLLGGGFAHWHANRIR